MKTKLCLTLATALLLVPQFLKGEDSLPLANDAAAKLRIGFIDPAAPGATPSRNAAALAFAQTQGVVTRLQPLPKGGLRAPEGRVYAPEEFDVIWYHQAEAHNLTLGQSADADLAAYVEGGGVLLLSGAAGRLVNDMDIESTAPRVLGPSSAPFVSGVVVREKHRNHPAFAGLDAAKPLILTSVGGNALADFYGTAGPHGELLAEGNAGVGPRPLVEYTVGAGRMIFVGWRLADFTTAKDAYRPNLERLFGNLLRYLAERNANRAQLILPTGEATYTRLLGVPFLRSAKPVAFAVAAAPARTAVTIVANNETPDSFVIGDVRISERDVTGDKVIVQALALTLHTREKALAGLLAVRKAEQEAEQQREREMLGNLRIIKPAVEFIKAPLKPSKLPDIEQSVLFGRSHHQASDGDITPVYEPVEDGGFRISNSRRQFNRPIAHGQNRIWTGDAPIFRMDTTAGNGCYIPDRVFPLWARPDAAAGNVYPSMGTLRIGVQGADGAPRWLDEMTAVTATFRPGYTEYEMADKQAGWKASLMIAPALDFHGFVCRLGFDQPVRLVWQYGGMWWNQAEANANRVELQGQHAWITEPNLPNGIVGVGWDGSGEGRTLKTGYGQQVEFRSTAAQQTFLLTGVWGVTQYDEARAKQTMARLDTPTADGWAAARDQLKQSWFDCYIGRALQPREHLAALMAKPDEALQATKGWWDARRAEFQVRTPDAHFNALMNFARAISEYHRQGPGLVLGSHYWIMYSHISTGWYGKEWGGDHQALAECLRLYAAFQGDNGFIRWVSPSLTGFDAENNTPYWVDHVWRHYTWTGDKQFVQDMWPTVRKAVSWMCEQNDPDGDGLFRDCYEYWNCDSNGKGPKAATPSAMAWAMLDRAARIAAVLGDGQAEKEYRALADKSKTAIFRELWNPNAGRLGSIGADGIWRGHPQVWEEYLAINAGLLSPEQGRSAMRWIAAHYGYEPKPGVKLLSCSDWFPIRWSVQWTPTGDTLMAALGGMKAGDGDLWWPYVKSVVGSAFHSNFPGINMGIGKSGAGGGEREDVDSADPHTHLTVRGLFGLEPALHEGRIDICPAFPADWKEAEIRTPDVAYTYRRDGDLAVFRIHTPKPVVKRVKANLSGPEEVTKAETDSTVRVRVGPAIVAPKPTTPPPILADTQPPTEADTGKPLLDAERTRQLLFDLTPACNQTVEEFTATPFVFDYADDQASGKATSRVKHLADGPQPLKNWWGTPPLTMGSTPKVLKADNGVTFLISGRPRLGLGLAPKNLITLASWKPYPLPAGAVIPVGIRCERLWLLLQSYVHPTKNYIPNGEVILHYQDGTTAMTQLIPPFNLDVYFQHFSRQGICVPLGRVRAGGFVDIANAHADALQIGCDPGKILDKVELRATCSEGVLGLAGMTALKAP